MSKRAAEVQLTQDNVDEVDEATDEVNSNACYNLVTEAVPL